MDEGDRMENQNNHNRNPYSFPRYICKHYMVASCLRIWCNLKYSVNSLVVMISGIIYPFPFIIVLNMLYNIQIAEKQHEIVLIINSDCAKGE